MEYFLTLKGKRFAGVSLVDCQIMPQVHDSIAGLDGKDGWVGVRVVVEGVCGRRVRLVVEVG